MSDSATTESSDRALALAAVRDFHEYFSKPPPFTDGSRYTLPHGFSVVPLPAEMGGLKVETFAELFERVSKLLIGSYNSGVKSFGHRLTEPEAEIWIFGNLAAVLVGWIAQIDGRDFVQSINLCGLHRVAGGSDSSDENPWRVSGLTDMTHVTAGMPLPPLDTGPLSEIIAPFEALLACIQQRSWEAIPSLLIPHGGATVCHGSQSPVTFAWPEFIKQLQVDGENGAVADKKLLDCETRRYGDLGFVWAPFTVVVNGSEQARGVSICTLRLEETRWLISGIQETISSM